MTGKVAPLRIGFIGTGPVAITLARAWLQLGHRVQLAHARAEVVNRGWTHALPLVGSAQELVDRCDLILLTVPDDAIARVCGALRWHERVAVVHCSGATEVSALAAAAGAGAATGGFHPLQMFANPDVALAGLSGCAVGIEAPAPLRGQLHGLAHGIGLHPFDLQPGVRARYHASANYVGPFVIALLQEAVNLWTSFGATEAEAVAALRPLLTGTLAAVDARGLAGGMGGCVARGDVGTVATHLRALDALSPATGALYRELTRRTIPLAVARGTLGADGAERIAACLDAPQSAV